MRWNVKSQFSTKQGALATHFATGMSRKFQSPVTKLAKLYFLFCNDLVVLTLQLLAYFTCVLHFGKSPLAGQLQVPVMSHFLLLTLDQIFTLSHTQPLHYSHINTGFLNAELQVNLARNKTNT